MKKLLLILSVFSILSSTWAQNTPTGSTTAPTPTPTVSSGAVASSDYKISPGDQVQFNIVGEVETSTVNKVSEEGKIILPFIGNIDVAGLSVSEAREKITSLYKPDYYIDPQVNLIVTNYKVRIVNFIGTGINRPGPVEMPNDRDLFLLEAISRAGSFSRVGSNKVEIKRVGLVEPNGKPKILRYDTSKIGPQDVKLEPNDVINVGEFGLLGNW